MEWIFYIMIVFCLFDIEEKLRKIMSNNKQKNGNEKEKNKIILKNYINKKVSITIDNDDINNSYLFSSISQTVGEITTCDSRWFAFKYYDKEEKKTVTQYFRIKDLVSIDEIK